MGAISLMGEGSRENGAAGESEYRHVFQGLATRWSRKTRRAVGGRRSRKPFFGTWGVCVCGKGVSPLRGSLLTNLFTTVISGLGTQDLSSPSRAASQRP